MSGLSDEDKSALRWAISYGCGCIGNDGVTLCRNCSVAEVEIVGTADQIVTRAVNAALNEAANAIEARMGRDADYDDGMEDAADIVRNLRTN